MGTPSIFVSREARVSRNISSDETFVLGKENSAAPEEELDGKAAEPAMAGLADGEERTVVPEYTASNEDMAAQMRKSLVRRTAKIS